MLIHNLNNIFFLIFLIVTLSCSDSQTTLKPSETTLETVKQLNTSSSTVDKGFLNATAAAPQNKSNASEERTTEPELTEATILNHTKCDEMKKEVCIKTLLQSWNPNTCKCEEAGNIENGTVGSNQNNSTVLFTTSSPLAINTTDTTKKSFWSHFAEIAFRSPFLPRLG